MSDARKAISLTVLIRTGLVAAAMLSVFSWLYAQEASTVLPSNPDARNSDSNAASEPRAMADEYVISPDDKLEILVLDVPELSRDYRVSPNGMITIPVLRNSILAAGMTPSRLSESIGKELQTAGMVDNPHVTVQVKESRVHAVAIAGAVKRPQIYPVLGKTTILDALSQAEGLAEDAGTTAIITRGDTAMRMVEAEQQSRGKGNEPSAVSQTVSVDLKKLLEEGDPSVNVDLYPGDRVTVQRAGVIWVAGGVNRPGGYVLTNDREHMTVLKAIALAQDIKSSAKPKEAVIIRKQPGAPDGTVEIPIRLNKILAKRAPDLPLLANDVLFVPDSASKKAMLRGAEAFAQAATLLVYRVPL